MVKYYSLTLLVLLTLILVFSTGCTPKSKQTDTATGLSAVEKDAPDSVYTQNLEAFDVGTVEISEDEAAFTSVNTVISEGLSAQTSIQYVKNSSDKYIGEMTVNLHKTSSGSSKYILNISKSFANNVNQLSFNIKPEQIIQSDPVVAWNVDKDNELKIKSTKTYNKDEMTHALSEEAFTFQYSACEKIDAFEESTVCEWRLIEKYKNEPFMKEVLSGINLASPDGAAVHALLDGKYDACVKYLSGEQKDKCLQVVFRAQEYECRSAQDQKDCVRKILWPLGLNNIQDLCSFIKDSDMKKECQGKIDSDTCEELKELDQKNKCLINIARTSKDVKDCDKIDSLDDKDACRKFLGTDNNDADVCLQINDLDTKDECLADVAMHTKNKDLCDKIVSDDAKGLCQIYLMSNEGKIDKSKCDKMKEGWIKDMCNSCYAVSIKDMKVCNQVKDTETLHMCQMMVGVVLNDSSICETFKDVADKDLCYSMFGLILDKKYCNQIENEEMKKDCIKTPLPEKLKDTNTTIESTAPATVSGPCPVNAPSTAKKYDQSSQSGGWMIRYALPSGASVGQELYYYDAAKKQIASSKCYNLQGELHGPSIIYNKDGTKSAESNYKNGQMDGVSKQWRSGTLETEQTYKDGKPNGAVMSYNTEKGATFGKVLYKGFYLGYKKTGDWTYYNGVTGVLEEEATYDNDCATKDKKYYEDGSVSYEKTGTCVNSKFTGTEITYARPVNGKQSKTTCQIENNNIKSCV
jgi:antitoxin component YwqK of YwqJK toxin-antitoxin module